MLDKMSKDKEKELMKWMIYNENMILFCYFYVN